MCVELVSWESVLASGIPDTSVTPIID